MVKNLPAMQETQVPSLGWEDLLEKGMAIHSNILAWEIPWTEKPSGLQPMGSQRVGHNSVTKTHTTHLIKFLNFLIYIYCIIRCMIGRHLGMTYKAWCLGPMLPGTHIMGILPDFSE